MKFPTLQGWNWGRALSWMRIGAWVLPWVFVASATALDTNKIPELKPPLGELPPSWWEVNLWSVIGAILVVLAVGLALVRLLVRPRISRALLPEVVARAALEKLRSAPDDVATAAEAGRQTRRFAQAVLQLPAGELTTEETLQAVARQAKPLPSGLVDSLATLLRECDARRFAPVPPAGQAGLAARALELADKLEAAVQPQSGTRPPQPE